MYHHQMLPPLTFLGKCILWCVCRAAAWDAVGKGAALTSYGACMHHIRQGTEQQLRLEFCSEDKAQFVSGTGEMREAVRELPGVRMGKAVSKGTALYFSLIVFKSTAYSPLCIVQ